MFLWCASKPAGVSFSIVVMSGFAVTATVMVCVPPPPPPPLLEHAASPDAAVAATVTATNNRLPGRRKVDGRTLLLLDVGRIGRWA
jgi:hypothetical protein